MGWCDQSWRQWARGKALKARTSSLAPAMSGAALSKRSASMCCYVVPLGGDLLGAHLGEDRPEGGGHHLLVAFGDRGQQVAGEVDPAALVGRPLEAAPDGRHQAGVLVGDHQAARRRAPGASRHRRNSRQKASSSESPTSMPSTSRRPSSVTPVAMTTALEVTWWSLSDVQVGGVEPDVGELGVVEAALLEGRHHLVETRQMRLTSDLRSRP